jgi:hypothetical protein
MDGKKKKKKKKKSFHQYTGKARKIKYLLSLGIYLCIATLVKFSLALRNSNCPLLSFPQRGMIFNAHHLASFSTSLYLSLPHTRALPPPVIFYLVTAPLPPKPSTE